MTGPVYRVEGDGPAVVFVNQARRPSVWPLLGVLREQHRVVEIRPLGFAGSPRLAVYPEIHRQVLDVLDHEGVDSFAVWGYSQGAAMAATVATATDRATALVVGGCSLLSLSPATLARLVANPRAPEAPRAFWREFAEHDWRAELAAMRCRTLVYVGAEDRQGQGVRRTAGWLTEHGVTVWELDGLDHRTCHEEPAASARVAPAVMDWLGVG